MGDSGIVFIPDRPPTQWQAPIYYEGRYWYWWPGWGWRPIEWTPPPQRIPIQAKYSTRDANISESGSGGYAGSGQSVGGGGGGPSGGYGGGGGDTGLGKGPRGVMYYAQPSRPYYAGYTKYGRTPVNQYGYYTYYSYPYNDLGESRSYHFRYQ